jgi:hypothetical protein
MLIPSFLYGLTRDVKRNCRKIVTKLKKGVTWDDATEGPCIETSEKPGLLVLDGPSPLLGGENHFHLYILHRVAFEVSLDGMFTEEIMDHYFHQSILQPWSISGILGGNNAIWFVGKNQNGKIKSFIEAIITFWPILAAEGSRYTIGSNTPQELRLLPTNIQYALANYGVSTEVLGEPLPEEGIGKLVPDLKKF